MIVSCPSNHRPRFITIQIFMSEILTPQERLEKIVDTAYEILCGKVASGSISIDNEAALQLQLSVILEHLGRLYEFDKNDHFNIFLERAITLKSPTLKSPKRNARCDIMLELQNTKGGDNAQIAIELKFLKKRMSGETITTNRFNVIRDINNLEQYKQASVITDIPGCEIVYTNNKNHTTAGSIIGNEAQIHGPHTHTKNGKKESVTLNDSYTCNWDEYNDKHFFLKIKV